MTQTPLSVVVPTIGRPRQLSTCLKGLTACLPRPAEILVIDQSGTTDVRDVVEGFADFGARAIGCDGRGPALARNTGLERARHEFVLLTDDDCTVSVDWIGTASKLMARDPTAIFTGSVLPAGDPLAIPSTIDDPVPHDYTDEIQCDVLYSNNMVCARSRVLASGGFDNRLLTAEDNDLCYRWLRSGHRLLYEPTLRVWHHDWR